LNAPTVGKVNVSHMRSARGYRFVGSRPTGRTLGAADGVTMETPPLKLASPAADSWRDDARASSLLSPYGRTARAQPPPGI
jgi:hypothetical protein